MVDVVFIYPSSGCALQYSLVVAIVQCVVLQIRKYNSVKQICRSRIELTIVKSTVHMLFMFQE